MPFERLLSGEWPRCGVAGLRGDQSQLVAALYQAKAELPVDLREGV